MNSRAEPLLIDQLERELLRFDHPSQWKERPGWRERLRLSADNPPRILGGYNLGRDLWQNCGLCTREHGRGYVVATEEGLETQIGKDCGARHLGAKFEEIERQFTAKLEAHDRLKRLSELAAQRDALLTDAQQAMLDCDAAATSVWEFKSRIDRERTLAQPFQAALVADGRVTFDVRVSQDEYDRTKQRHRRETVGRIDGHTAASTKNPAALIRATVLPFLRSLTDEALSSLNNKGLQEKAKAANDATSALIDARAFVALARRFTSRRNWQTFASAFENDRLRTNDRGRRILQQLIELGAD